MGANLGTILGSAVGGCLIGVLITHYLTRSKVQSLLAQAKAERRIANNQRQDQHRSDVQKAGGEGCTWLNDLLRTMWPAIDTFVITTVVRGSVEEMLQDKIGKAFKFSKATLGAACPVMGPITSCQITDHRGKPGVYT